MIYSYYFDLERQHVINFGFDVESVVTKTNGSVEATFTAYIEELNGPTRKKKESTRKTFLFSAGADIEKHDIDFLRTRYEPEQKWIYTIKNNKVVGEEVTIGLITDSGNMNPLGFDVFFESTSYSAELKGNNLAKLGTGYLAPRITQTLLNESFKSSGFPANFVSSTAQYDTTFQLIETKEFEQTFFEDIPKSAAFVIQMDLAPKTVDVLMGNEIGSLDIENLGVLSITTDGIEFSSSQRTVSKFFGFSVTPSDFYNLGFQPISRLKIDGDGAGNLTVTYGGVTLHATYESQMTFRKMKFKGKPENIVGTVNIADPQTWIGFKIDNFIAQYTK